MGGGLRKGNRSKIIMSEKKGLEEIFGDTSHKKNQDLQDSRNPKSVESSPKKSFFGLFVSVFLIGSIAGALSSYGFFYYYFLNNDNKLGSITRQITEKVTVEEESGVIDAVEKISPSVVSITTTSLMQSYFGGVVEQKGGGTGFVITNDGLIATNKHVVAGASELKIITKDGDYYDGEVVATDPLFDIALVKIDAKDLVVAELGDSDALLIGQRAITIGNALGEYQNTVTVGVISGRARAITASEKKEQLE